MECIIFINENNEENNANNNIKCNKEEDNENNKYKVNWRQTYKDAV